jgi:hypothetical protein
MQKEASEAIAELKAEGLKVAGDPSGRPDVYIVTTPNGEEYEFLAAALLNLRAKGTLNLAGVEECHLAKKKTPSL